MGAAPAITSMVYDPVGNALRTTDPLGHQTTVAYDALDRPILTTGPDGTTTSAAYTSTGFKYQVTDQNGHSTSTTYDAAGRALSVIGAPVQINGTGPLVSPVTSTSYDPAGNSVQVTNALGNITTFAYDARNRKIQEVEPPVIDASTGSTTPVSPVMTWTYDNVGNTTAVTDARGNTTTSSYDPANRVTDVTQPAVSYNGNMVQPHMSKTYDLDSNILTMTDPDNHITTNTYDLLNRMLTSTDAASITVNNAYDSVGNKVSVTNDPNGLNQTTTWTYDGLNRNTTTTDPAHNQTTLTYNSLNKISRTDALSQITSYAYDVRNRLTAATYASTKIPASNFERDYNYDNVGNLLAVNEPTNSAADVANTYDALNRLIAETSGGMRHTYSYDLVNNRLTTIYGGTNRTITSTYDVLNRLSIMTESGRPTGYGYDLNGNIIIKLLPNSDEESMTYDALNRDTGQMGTHGTNTLFQYNNAYDLAGNVLAEGEMYPGGLNNRTVTNSYDNIYRLTTEAAVTSATNTTTTYSYDNANNRATQAVSTNGSTVTTSYTYNSLNQLTTYTDTTSRAVNLTYDVNGNRITRTVSGAPDTGTDIYNYDAENRLVSVTKGTAGTGTGTYNYSYDYRTRRILRDESQVSGGTSTQLIFSGGTSVQEYDNANTTPTVEYIRGSDYGGGVGGILYTLRSGTPSYTHENKRGDVVAKTDATGSLTYQAQYQAFGAQVATSGATLDRQKANSKDYDGWGATNEGFRYRELETGTFLTRDPAGMIDGPNEYCYVHQNPWTSFDPEGLDGQNESSKHPVPQAPNLIKPRQFVIRNEYSGPQPPSYPHPEDTTKTEVANVLKKGYPDAPNPGTNPADVVLGNVRDPGLRPASVLPGGPTTYDGKPLGGVKLAIDKAYGGKILTQAELNAAVDAKLLTNPEYSARVEAWKKSQSFEGEVLLPGPIPSGAIARLWYFKMFNRGAFGLSSAGVVLSGIGEGTAIGQSIQTGSPLPARDESIRQIGGWGGAFALGRLGALAGGGVGSETGPGAIVTAGVGGLGGGFLGYYGVGKSFTDWLDPSPPSSTSPTK